MLRRNRRPISANVLDRNSLHASKFSSIDTVLKDLKLHSRLLHVILSSQKNESQILERLYYKSKNQHHSALFWRHVCEMRRFAKRLEEFNVVVVLDSLRATFFRGADPTNAKSMSGSWSQYPDENYISNIITSLGSFSSLAQEMHKRLSKTYRSFSLAMQTGAFIQLILTLTAIASRMSVLVSELDDNVQKIKQVLVRLLSVLRNDQTSVPEEKSPALLLPAPQYPVPMEIPITVPVQPISRDVIERKRKVERSKPELIAATSIKKKKKKKNEIDDIFGF